ncbi:glycoside hydrolase family 3 C-terminal domain-containing protein [Catenulispora rubra]|uniref:glycoside hydrolase family 3 C-terminal domain-containing protein n=1 Tax=Catenulispora rubra TaxID=280293 RepID=UPI001E570E19|nr:glycoside hydrolase family 3 C-terminal domain-containing protein [Catenulispora rubra]
MSRSPRQRPVFRTLLAAGALFAASLAGLPSQAHAAAGTPFGGTPAALPGLVEAANYDTGGQGVAYNTAPGNGSANSYRADGIDLEATADTLGTSPAGGAYDIGWTTPGQWFNYTVSVATAGTYSVAFRLSSPYGLTDALHIADSSGANLTGSVAVPNTGGYETWTTVTASLNLPAGTQTLTVKQDSNGFNFHNMAFTLTAGGGGGGDKPFGGTPAPVPGTVQVANYDTGGQGVAYNTVAGNGTATGYRTDSVDLENTSDTQDTSPPGGPYDMGWTNAGQWFNYTVQVATSGTYTVSFRVSSPYGVSDALHIENASGANLTGSVAVPNTGSYATWTNVTATLTLPAGAQTLTVKQDANGFNLHFLTFTQGSGGGGPGPGQYCGTQDLAMDQPTTASSTYSATGNLAFAATDGDPGTRWESAYSDPQWLEVDLGSQQQICNVGILWENAYASAFQVQVSNDNATWTNVYSTTTGAGGHQTIPVSATDRYVRMYGTARATQWGYSILEFDVYGLTNTPPVTGGNGNGGNGVCPWVGSTAPVAQRVQQVLNTMNQSEELTLVAGDGTTNYIGHVAGIPNLCIAQTNMEDGPSGVGDGNGGVTAFPDGESAAATWDTTLIGQEGTAKGAEFAGKGANVSLGPTSNVVRDPRWGRTYETYGEDPFLAGQITSAEVKGLQSQGVMADVKHVAAYDQEQYPNGGNNEIVGNQAMQELYLAPFQDSIAQSAPASFMCSYAVVNNASSCASASMLRNGLDTQANYGGFVVSDWGAAGPAVADANGGLDIAMPFNSYATNLGNALAAGQFDQGTLNSIVARILTQMFAFGMFDNPASGSLSNTVTTAAHQQTALQLGQEGTVLLKNNGILPLNPNPGTAKSIAVLGTDGGAAVELAGGGSGGVDSSNTVWPVTGIQNAVGPNVKVTYTPGDDNGTTNIPQAVAAAQAATYAIVFVSAPEGEESDLKTLDVSAADETMISDVAAVNPNTIVVINSGSPVVMPWLNSVAGVFENWYGGQETGAAVASLIFGTVNPSGKLPVTFPSSLSQVPAQTTAQWPGTPTGPIYSEGVNIGYRWYQSQNITPAFPFGFGLSYTRFAFSNLAVGGFNANGQATVTATVTNTGSVAGAEVAQLYVGDPAASQDPPNQLAGFQRVMLNPGQSAQVSFPLTVHNLASWSGTDNQWEAQAGTYAIRVGDASNSLPLTGSTSLANTLTGQVAAGASYAGVSTANTAVSANVTPNSGVPGAETVGVVNPFGYSSPKGAGVSFAMQAVDSNSAQTLSYTATGLPPGISISNNGTISGNGTTLGTYTVTVTAKDSVGVSGTATFVWSVVQ